MDANRTRVDFFYSRLFASIRGLQIFRITGVLTEDFTDDTDAEIREIRVIRGSFLRTCPTQAGK